jgi:hypothetical protein
VPEFIKDFTPLVAIISLAVLGWAMLTHDIDGFLILTDIVAIAGIAGYKITKIPTPPISPK